MTPSKYFYSIFSNLESTQWLDARSIETSKQSPIPNSTPLNLYSELEMKELRRRGFSSSIGVLLMNRIAGITHILHPNKTIVLIDGKQNLISTAIWQHFQPTHPIFIYQGGVPKLLSEANEVFEKASNFVVLNGETGVGKTAILNKLDELGFQVLNLEKTANHQGSAFGNLTEKDQPEQDTFILNLAFVLSKFNHTKKVFLESEKLNLGKNMIPLSLQDSAQKGIQIRLTLIIEKRVERLVAQYAGLNDQKMKKAIKELQYRIGKEEKTKLIRFLDRKEYAEVAKGLLDYYDNSDSYQSLNQQEFYLTIENANISETIARLAEL